MANDTLNQSNKQIGLTISLASSSRFATYYLHISSLRRIFKELTMVRDNAGSSILIHRQDRLHFRAPNFQEPLQLFYLNNSVISPGVNFINILRMNFCTNVVLAAFF